jgi:uncharacterized protein involved in response to NO
MSERPVAIDSQTTTVPSRSAPAWALWQLGFRPFYLGAGIFAALSVPLWVLQISGRLGRPYLDAPAWHAHEMLFGYTLAVVVGFLFTAGHNWTGQPTPSGRLLQALVLLWLAGRVLVLTPWTFASALVNVAFPLSAAAALAVPLARSGNRRNYFFVGLLVLLASAQMFVHLAQAKEIALPPWLGLGLGLDVVLFLMAVMGGRVIPMLTNNGVPGAKAARDPRLERLALGSVIALVAADVVHLQGRPLALILILCAAAHAARWALWQPWTTLRTPLVWVLHAAYLWIPLHLAMRALAEFGVVPTNLATHALTVGAIGSLTLGMMTRTARGHTGRPLNADGWDVACYLCVLASALVRVFGPLLAPAAYLSNLEISAALWSAGFAIFTVRYAPILCRPRLDGRPG